MPSWEETKQAAQSVAGNLSYGMYLAAGDAYQRFMGGEISLGRTGLSQEIAENSWQLNPEYVEAERAYVVQETEAERIRGIDMTNIQPSEPQRDIEEPDMGR